jgi:hypothetical protein
MVNLNTADAAAYFYARRTNGFNGSLICLVAVAYTGGRSDGSTIGGIVPFTNSVNGQFDLASLNLNYFALASNYVTMAATNGIVVFLDPLETGGMLPIALTNGPAKCFAYGQFIGNWFKRFTNVAWMHGNDYHIDAPNVGYDDQCLTNIAWGIRTTATNHPQCIELEVSQPTAGINYTADGMEGTNWWPLINLSLAYTYDPTYNAILHEYHRTNAIPELLGEAHYEGESLGGPPDAEQNVETGNPAVLRRQAYWTLLAGGCGQIYGNNPVYLFTTGWQAALASQDAKEASYWNNLATAHKWWTLVPDTNHTVITAGYGSYALSGLVSANDYAAAASSLDGTLAIAYIPTSRTLTVAMTHFSNSVIARWFDPTANTFTAIAGSPFANTITANLTTPGSNWAGDGDWVLVLQAQAPNIVSPQITAWAFSNNNFTVSFSTVSGQSYALNKTTDLASDSWLSVATNISGTGGTVQVADTNSLNQPRQFYRVKTGM